jgi:hypothetical protein
MAPELYEEHAHRKAEGAGNAGRALHPRPPVQQESTGVSNLGHTAIVRHSLRDGFNGLFRALLGDRAFLPPSPARHVSVVANLAPASGRQDHTALPSAKRIVRPRKRFAHSTPRPPQSRSAFVTIAIRPSGERNGLMKRLIWGKSEAECFSGKDWTTQIALILLGKFLFWRRAFAATAAPHHVPQSATNSPGTRANSRTFAVTSVAPLRRAWAAMR